MTKNADSARAADRRVAGPDEAPHQQMSPTWAHWFDESTLVGLQSHPLLRALSRGQVGLGGIRTLLVQHQHYARHFTKYLCALMSNLSEIGDVRALMINLSEEMGVSVAHIGPNMTHAELFQQTLQELGADPRGVGPLAATSALSATVMNYCRQRDPLEGIAALCLGAEAVVPLIYRPILDALIAHGVGDRGTEFFRVHLEEDEGHALTMLAILERLARRDPAIRARARSIGADVIARRCDMLAEVWQLVRAGEEPLATRAAGDSRPTFSSIDFGRVTAKPTVSIAERLLHRGVTLTQDADSTSFTRERRHKVSIVDLPTVTISVTIGELEPGQATRMHRHNYETVIYVLSGSGHSQIEHRSIAWTAGDAFYVPVWAAHQHFSDGPDPCTYLACENAPLLQNLGNIALREEL
jgi:pyrroloquinoline-quinone synthase